MPGREWLTMIVLTAGILRGARHLPDAALDGLTTDSHETCDPWTVVSRELLAQPEIARLPTTGTIGYRDETPITGKNARATAEVYRYAAQHALAPCLLDPSATTQPMLVRTADGWQIR